MVLVETFDMRRGRGGGFVPVENRIHIRTSDDLTAWRSSLLTDVFAGSLPSEDGTLSSVTSPVAGLTGLDTCEKITMSASTSRPRVWTPTSPNGDLVILHQGHTGGYNSYGYGTALQSYLTAGFTVCGLVMPGGADEVTSSTSGDHNSGQESLDYFITPIIVAINTLEADVTNIYMTGLSGGGWSTVLAAALDTRIQKSYPTSGSLPIQCSTSRDWEQYLPGVRSLGYEDLYLLGACGAGRRQKQINHIADDCCFKRADYEQAPPYADALATIAASLGGDFDLVWREKATHFFDATIIDEEVLAEIEP
jgi:hypothetical protein